MTEVYGSVINNAKQDLLSFIGRFDNAYNIPVIERAIDFAISAHDGQTRASGEPFVLHPIMVARLVGGLYIDTTTVVAALLHDVVEDTNITLDEIRLQFWPEVATIVDGVTKIGRANLQPELNYKTKNLYKIFLAFTNDVRVLFVKLADRLHNIQTLSCIKDAKKRLSIAKETIDIYAPLAERMGIHAFKNGLQDSAFAEMEPKMHKWITEKLINFRYKTLNIVQAISNDIRNMLLIQGKIDADVVGREKNIYGIWKKLETKKISFEEILDILGFRIIVTNTNQCYSALGIMHVNYRSISYGFKDYISNPKINGYQSLHTVVIGPMKKPIEIQIRTTQMHEMAEFGIAAHWTYKHGYKHSVHQNYYIESVRELLNTGADDCATVMDVIADTYYDQISCFSENGQRILLPIGASILDFAFAIDVNDGIKCCGAIVDGIKRDISWVLYDGNRVQILMKDEPQVTLGWEKIVITGRARAALRAFFAKCKKEREDKNM